MTHPRMPANWPYQNHARRVALAPNDWCLLDVGVGPVVLLLHGAGGSGHSFRNLIPLLAGQYRVIVPDLPGQGFSRAGARGRLGLDAMAADLCALCRAEGVVPAVIIGHSAGGAIALRMAEMMEHAPCVIGINAALGEFEGAAGVLFPLMAKVLSLLPLIPTVVSKLSGTAARVDGLLASTGSKIDPAGRAQYLALVRDSGHIEGTLGMMSQWNLQGLVAQLPAIDTPVLLIASAGDKAVPARISQAAAAKMPNAEVVVLTAFGHLVHEEAAEAVAAVILPWLAQNIKTAQP